MPGQLGRAQEVVTRRERDGVQTGDRWDGRPRAGGDQCLVELERLTLAFDRVLRDEPGPATNERHTLVAFDPVLVERDALVDDPSDARHDGRKVHLDRTQFDPELGGLACVVRYLGCPDQGLRRDAPASQSGAADRSALE